MPDSPPSELSLCSGLHTWAVPGRLGPIDRAQPWLPPLSHWTSLLVTPGAGRLKIPVSCVADNFGIVDQDKRENPKHCGTVDQDKLENPKHCGTVDQGGTEHQCII